MSKVDNDIRRYFGFAGAVEQDALNDIELVEELPAAEITDEQIKAASIARWLKEQEKTDQLDYWYTEYKNRIIAAKIKGN